MSNFSAAIGLLEQRDLFCDYTDAIRVLRVAERADRKSMIDWLTDAERALRSQHGDFRAFAISIPEDNGIAGD